MGTDFSVTFREDTERGKIMSKIFGTTTVCVKSPIPEIAYLPDIGKKPVYELDITQLTADQRGRLINYLAERFACPESMVDAELENVGCPILAEDVVVAVKNPQKWF